MYKIPKLSFDQPKAGFLHIFRAQEQILRRSTTGSFHHFAPALAHRVDTLYCLLRWVLKRQYRKVDSPIHYRASRITFSSDTVSPVRPNSLCSWRWKQFGPGWLILRDYVLTDSRDGETLKKKKDVFHRGIFVTEIYWT